MPPPLRAGTEFKVNGLTFVPPKLAVARFDHEQFTIWKLQAPPAMLTLGNRPHPFILQFVSVHGGLVSELETPASGTIMAGTVADPMFVKLV